MFNFVAHGFLAGLTEINPYKMIHLAPFLIVGILSLMIPFFQLLEEYLDISEFIPSVYYTSNPGLLLLYYRSVSPKVKAIS